MLALMGRPNLGTHGFSVARRWTVTSASSVSVLPGLTDLARDDLTGFTLDYLDAFGRAQQAFLDRNALVVGD